MFFHLPKNKQSRMPFYCNCCLPGRSGLRKEYEFVVKTIISEVPPFSGKRMLHNNVVRVTLDTGRKRKSQVRNASRKIVSFSLPTFSKVAPQMISFQNIHGWELSIAWGKQESAWQAYMPEEENPSSRRLSLYYEKCVVAGATLRKRTALVSLLMHSLSRQPFFLGITHNSQLLLVLVFTQIVRWRFSITSHCKVLSRNSHVLRP